MTYFGFLARFLGIPLVVLGVLTGLDARRGRRLPPQRSHFSPWGALLLHVAMALVWTTPWDNYLVATGVWYYEPQLVTGMTIGWVPIEEYTFFVVQTLVTGLWLLWLGRRMRPAPEPAPSRPRLRIGAAGIAAAIWLAGVLVWASGWKPGAYLGLELGWMLFPVIIQLLVGADLLWHHRRWVLASLLPPWLYLSFADALAIGSGTWTIAPDQSTGVMLGGLPIEEFIFFLLTNMLIVFGMTLLLTLELATVGGRFGRRRAGASTGPLA